MGNGKKGRGSSSLIIFCTPIPHKLNSGTLDVLKRRFAAALRSVTRHRDDVWIFISHLPERPIDQQEDNDDDE
ncbi:hypothetical protein PtB15_10B319 [Puccinia triticina]|nr:hypothetical protein PtB15_10B319 [Puccinia triticina]